MEWHSVLLLLALHTCVASSFIAPGAPQCKSRAHSFSRDGHQKRKLDPVALDQPSTRRPSFVKQSLSRVLLGDRARGLALVRGEPPFLRLGGNPPARAFPFGETG